MGERGAAGLAHAGARPSRPSQLKAPRAWRGREEGEPPVNVPRGGGGEKKS